MRQAFVRALATAVAVVSAFVAGNAEAFSVLWDYGTTADDKAQLALRWAAEPDPIYGTGLHDKIQVAISPTFATDLGVANIAALYGMSVEEVTDRVHKATRRAFQSWESAVLQFEVTFDGPAVVGPTMGQEIDVFAVSSADPYFGWADPYYYFASGRLLTNGQRNDGYVIVGADIFLNATRIGSTVATMQAYGIGADLLQNALQILLAHELGHALGLGHVNLTTFLDTDTDAYNEMVIDPTDPFAGLLVSSIPADTSGEQRPVMWGGTSSSSLPELLKLLSGLNDPQLRPDDHGGRDVLYPTSLPPPMIDCTEIPETDCRIAEASTLTIKDKDDDSANSLSWKWKGASAVSEISYGKPTSRNSYALCLYTNASSATPDLEQIQLPGGLPCGDKPCWKGSGDPAGSKGWKYKNKGQTPSGLTSASLKPGEAGKAKIQIGGKGVLLALPSMPVVDFPLLVQFQGNGRCWQADFDAANVKKNDATEIKLSK